MGANQDIEKVAMFISVTNAMNWQATSEGARAIFQQECKSHERWYDAVANESDESLKDDFFDNDKEKKGMENHIRYKSYNIGIDVPQEMNRLENIFLMRHAHSAGNEDLALYRHIPDHAIPLSGKGEKQAAEAGRQFAAFLAQSPSLIGKQGMRLWYSPYLRTKQTRDGLLEGMGSATGIFTDRREHILLTEQNFGLFDGLSDEECDEKYPEESRKYKLCAEYKGRFYAKPPNGESRYDVCVRVHQFFGTIVRDAEKSRHPVPNVFIVLHGNTLRAFIMMWLHREVEWFENERNPANCAIRHVGRDPNGRFEDRGYIFKGFKEEK